ncbi:MAG: polyphosphate polymerase domain-containing protein [Candidatus Eisenbacteria sp.]|nr:polyphosphate polymerase domain-containing protein [Candidatus Eisenbacteria bacterium]
MNQDRFERFELKYFISPDEMKLARRMVAPFMRTDQYATGRPGNRYTVRSIYLDTLDLRFYYEKEAGLKIRKKLRLRTYNRYSRNAASFFEIKRKYGQAILKERVGMSFARAAELLQQDPVDRVNLANLEDLDLSAASRASLKRFFFLEEVLLLQPSVLVVYDREPYVGLENPRVRVTFDCDVRSIIRPDLEDIFTDTDFRHLTDRRQILEIKFDGSMPPWLRPLTARLDRGNRPISKYCRGIDLWAPAMAGPG